MASLVVFIISGRRACSRVTSNRESKATITFKVYEGETPPRDPENPEEELDKDASY